MRNKTFILIIISISIITIWFWGYDNESSAKIRTLHPERGEISTDIILTGITTTKKQVSVKPTIFGTIKTLNKEEDTFVQENEVLAKLDDREIKTKINIAKAVLLRTKEQYSISKRNLNVAEQQFEIGNSTKESVENHKSELHIAKTNHQEAVQNVNLAYLELEQTTILSPFSGTIITQKSYLNQQVTPDTELFYIANLDNMIIEAQVDASDVTSINSDSKVIINRETDTSTKWKGKILQIGRIITKSNNANTVTIKILPIVNPENSKSTQLRLGEQLDISIQTNYKSNIIKLPFNVIINKNGKTMIALLQDDMVVKMTEISTGLENLTHTEILHGIDDNQTVIIPDGKEFHTGEKVITSNKESE